jgi:ribosomal protein S2
VWTRVINYSSIVKFGLHLGAEVQDSSDHVLNSLLMAKRSGRYIFKFTELVFNMLINRIAIKKAALSGANFLFLTTRPEYTGILRENSAFCSEASIEWFPGLFTSPRSSAKFMPEFKKNYNCGIAKTTPDLILLFDNSRFTSRHVLSEVRGRDFPIFSIMDTDSCILPDTFHIYGNDDSIESI